VCVQALKEHFVAGSGRGSLTHHHDIEAVEILFMQAKGFANGSFQAISLNRQPAVLFRYRQSESGTLPAAFARKDGEQLIPTSICTLENAPKGSSVE
jgi:hypothetical protein